MTHNSTLPKNFHSFFSFQVWKSIFHHLNCQKKKKTFKNHSSKHCFLLLWDWKRLTTSLSQLDLTVNCIKKMCSSLSTHVSLALRKQWPTRFTTHCVFKYFSFSLSFNPLSLIERCEIVRQNIDPSALWITSSQKTLWVSSMNTIIEPICFLLNLLSFSLSFPLSFVVTVHVTCYKFSISNRSLLSVKFCWFFVFLCWFFVFLCWVFLWKNITFLISCKLCQNWTVLLCFCFRKIVTFELFCFQNSLKNHCQFLLCFKR